MRLFQGYLFAYAVKMKTSRNKEKSCLKEEFSGTS